VWTDGKGKKGERRREAAMEDDRVRGEGQTEGEGERIRGREGVRERAK